MTRTTSIVQVSSESLRGLPGYALRSLAEVWLDHERLAHVVDAALADVHAEWGEARAANRVVRARWIALRGNAALAFGLTACALAALRADLPRLASIAAGALLFPLALFWMLAHAIQSGPSIHTDGPLRTWDLWIRPPSVIREPERIRLVKAVPKRGSASEVHGAGLVVRPDKSVLDPTGLGYTGAPELDIPRRPDLRTTGAGRESGALALVRIPPDYPPIALQRGIEGFVVVRLWVGTRGEVTRAEVAQASPRRVFDRAALDAVRRWRYRPAQSEGEAVAHGPIEVLLDFRLSDAQR